MEGAEKNFKDIFKFINDEKADNRSSTKELKQFAWMSLIKQDENAIRTV
jgi:hypothetical protein